MNFFELVQNVLNDAVVRSLSAFRPELTLCVTIVVLLLARMILPRWKTGPFLLTVVGLVTAMFFAFPASWLPGGIPAAQPIFTGMVQNDSFTVIYRVLLLTFALLFASFTQVSDRPNPEDRTEFFIMMLGALLGMCLMISANHLIIVLIGMEMASLPSYVLAGFERHRRQGSEAALKYAVFGAGAAGIMLFGMSLLIGTLGSAHLPTMAKQMAGLLETGVGPERTLVLLLGCLMVLVGVAFKLSAFPFHFWAPDVFEGALAEVGAFLSVASKAAALGLLVRLVSTFSYTPDMKEVLLLAPVRQYMVMAIGILSAVTCTFGNLAAYGQTNLKRLLAYSTIAHAGYMMMPIAAMVALEGESPDLAKSAVAALTIYVCVYLFMNLAAFAGVAFLRNASGSENLDDFAGLVYRSPAFTVCFAIVMFSLLGLPPLAGFTAKVSIFIPLLAAKMYFLLAIGLLNTVLSLFYYLRVVKVMTLGKESEEKPAPRIALTSGPGVYFLLLTFPVVALFFLWGGMNGLGQIAASRLF